MANLRLDFLNKNMYRKYPLRASSQSVFTNGTVMPLALITSAQITTTYNYSQIYISQIYVNGDYINITIQEAAYGLTLGCFSGNITSYQQILTLQPFNDVATGTITISSAYAFKDIAPGMYTLTEANGRFEDSVIYCFTPPAVTSINDTAVGAISLVGNNIMFNETTDVIELEVINTATILANNCFSAEVNNCPTPLITQINTVFPNGSGNIDLYGIEPVTIAVSGGVITVSLGSITLPQICPDRALIYPPDDSSNTYYTDILTTNTPEWQTWPQYE